MDVLELRRLAVQGTCLRPIRRDHHPTWHFSCRPNQVVRRSATEGPPTPEPVIRKFGSRRAARHPNSGQFADPVAVQIAAVQSGAVKGYAGWISERPVWSVELKQADFCSAVTVAPRESRCSQQIRPSVLMCQTKSGDTARTGADVGPAARTAATPTVDTARATATPRRSRTALEAKPISRPVLRS